MIVKFLNKMFINVIRIQNISNDLFQNIFHRYDTERTAEFIDDDGNVRLFLPQKAPLRLPDGVVSPICRFTLVLHFPPPDSLPAPHRAGRR